MKSAPLLVALLLTGCTSGGALTVGKASGVLKPADTITLPLADVRALEAAMYDRIMDGIEFRESIAEIVKRPGSTCKLPARYFAGMAQAREGAVEAHRQARRILDAPDLVEVDGARVIQLMIKAISVAAGAMK